MSELTLNKTPWFDDYDPTDNFYKILFKGRNAVQIRELNNLQSIYGNQLSNFADHIFKFGSIVKNVSLKYNNSQAYVRLKDLDVDVNDIDVSMFKNRTVFGASSGIKAKVLLISDKTSNDPATIFVNYENTGKHPTTGDDVKHFIWGEQIHVLDPNNENYSIYKAYVRCPTCPGTTDTDINIDPTGFGTVFNVSEGIYYVNGYFVRVHNQTVVLEKYSTESTYDVGLDVIQEIITTEDNNKLYDNALGSPNFAAPGADRLKISLNLVKKKEKSTTNDDFILVARIQQGILTQLYDKSQYAELMKTIARRTYDESGDYTLNPFKLYFKEHYKEDENDNNGYLLEAEGGDKSKLMAFIKSGKAYVRGYEIEKINETPVDMRKSRDTGKQRFNATRVSFSNYLLVKLDTDSNCFVSVDVEDHNQTYDFSDFVVYDGEASGLNPTGAAIGTFKAKDIELYSGTPGTDAIWKVYIIDVIFDSDKTILDAKSIKNTGTNILVANLVSDGEVVGGIDNANDIYKIYETGSNKLIYPLPKDHVKSIKDVDNPNESNTLLSIKKKYIGSVDNTGNVTFSAENGERFGVYNYKTWVIGVDNGSNYVAIEPLNVIVTQESLTIEAGTSHSGKNLCIIADTFIPGATEKRKTLNTGIIDNLQLSDLSEDYKIWLKEADIYDAPEIIMFNDGGSHTDEDAEDVSNQWEVNTGQTDNYYGIGYLQLKSAYRSTDFTGKKLYISFRYFSHTSSGYYFSVDSYREVIEDPTLDIDYESIPQHTLKSGETYRLSNVLDFRPKQGWDSTTNQPKFVSDNVEKTQYIHLPSSYIDVTYDIEFYLSRIDMICLHKNGNFFIEEGIPAEQPLAKKIPEHSMKLYEVTMKPYVYDLKKDVSPKYFENRRYTMRDIGKLEKRIENLEYYTSFTMLEKSTADMNIKDANGLDRFKNGFLVDPFNSFKASNLNTPQYNASIDIEKQQCKPAIISDNIQLVFNDSESDNYQISSHLVTLPYSDEVQQSQPYASKTLSVNPYEIFNMVGFLKLEPDHDVWVDTKENPTFVASQDMGLDDINLQDVNPNEIFWDGWMAGEPLDIDLGERVTDVQLATYMRSTELQFMASKLRPNTTVYAFFDNEPVSQYCRPLNGKFGQKMVTNDKGEFIGVFKIPKGKFFVGQKLFELTDEEDNAGDKDERTTSAMAKFHSGGIQKTTEDVTLSVKPPKILSTCEWGNKLYEDGTFLESASHYARYKTADEYTDGSTDIVSSTPFKNLGAICRNGNWVLFDPVAQSFIVDMEGGMFVTKINVYFAAKDTKAPVVLQLREMNNGYPSLKMPCDDSEVVIHPDDVIITNGSTPTTFKFPYPIYLEQGKEYCFVVISTSPNYRVHISKLGETDKITGSLISKQPHLGSLFKSQNNTTWTPEQYEDIKFELYRAKFDHSGELKAVFNNSDNRDQDVLSDNPFETQLDSNKIRVYHPNHHFIEGDKVKFNVLTETWYRMIITTGDVIVGEKIKGNTHAGEFYITEIQETDEQHTYNNKAYTIYQFKMTNLNGKIIENEGFIGSTDVEIIADKYRARSLGIDEGDLITEKQTSVGILLDAINQDINGIPITEVAKNVHTVQAVDSYNSYVITVNGLATSTGRTYGKGVLAESNVQIDLMRVRLQSINFDFNPEWTYKGLSHSGIGSEFNDYETVTGSCNLNSHTYLEFPMKLATKLNEDLIISKKSFTLIGQYKNSYGLDNLSPVIDLKSANLTMIANKINNQDADTYNIEPIHDETDQYIEETDSSEAMGICRYVSQVGNLKIPATSIKVYIDCHKNIFNTIDVYYRTVKTFEDVNINTKEWILAPFDIDFISEKPDEFIEGEISIPGIESDMTEIEEFKSYQIKIVMRTTNSAKPPKLMNLRTIAVS